MDTVLTWAQNLSALLAAHSSMFSFLMTYVEVYMYAQVNCNCNYFYPEGIPKWAACSAYVTST
jgi:hypothetical protein